MTLGDQRGGVSEEGGSRVGADAARDHGRPGPPLPARADARVREPGECEELPERASDVVRAQRTTAAAGEDGPVLGRPGHVGDAASQHDGRVSGTGMRLMDVSVLDRG